MNLNFILPAIAMSIGCFLATWWSIKSRKKYGVLRTAVNSAVLLLLAIEWLWVTVFFAIKPEAFPANQREIDIMVWGAIPMLTHIPLLFLFFFNIICGMMGKQDKEST